jgi:L-amino acid N-acyltransferase YncA
MPAPGADVRIEAMTDAHAAAVLAIYQAGMDEGNATFETRAPGWEEFTAARLACHRYVAVTGTGVLGWVAASAVQAAARWEVRGSRPGAARDARRGG